MRSLAILVGVVLLPTVAMGQYEYADAVWRIVEEGDCADLPAKAEFLKVQQDYEVTSDVDPTERECYLLFPMSVDSKRILVSSKSRLWSYRRDKALSIAPTFNPIGQVKPAGHVLDQPDAPVRVVEYKHDYSTGSKMSMKNNRDRGIYDEIRFDLPPKRAIFAVELRILRFDSFDRYLYTSVVDELFLDEKVGKSIEVRNRSLYREGSFFNSFLYVSAVRFVDGEIWTVDPMDILEVLKVLDDSVEAETIEVRPLILTEV